MLKEPLTGGFLRDLLVPSRPLALAGWSGPLWEEAGKAWHLREGPAGRPPTRGMGTGIGLQFPRLCAVDATGGFLRDLLGPFTEKDDEEAYGKGSREGRSLREGPGSYGSLHTKKRRRGSRAEPGSLYRRKSLHRENDEDAWALGRARSLTGMSASGRLCPYGKAGGTVLTGRARARRKMTESLCRKPRTGRDVHGKGRSSHERPG